MNRISDIEIVVEFHDEEGEAIAAPLYDYEITIFSQLASAEVTQKDGVLSPNAKVDEAGKLHIYIDNPSFGRGDLYRRSVLHIPDENFPDGEHTVVSQKLLGNIKDFNNASN